MDEDEPLAALVMAARTGALTNFVLSAIEASGHRLGTGAADELRRKRVRQDGYLDIIQLFDGDDRVRCVKGPSIAKRYPDGLLRKVGDLDLVAADEHALWGAVYKIMQHKSISSDDVTVTLFGHPERHTLVCLRWPGEDDLLDPDCGVDVCTAAFAGDRAAVPIRPDLPADQFTADLLMLAEQRFQREFGPADALDVAILGRCVPVPLNAIRDTAARYHLAPELDDLIRFAADRGDVGGLGDLLPLLTDEADRERARRSTWSAREAQDVDDHAAPMGGLLVRSSEWRHELNRARLVDTGGEAILRTPLGDYLLTRDQIVTMDRYTVAQSEAARLPELS